MHNTVATNQWTAEEEEECEKRGELGPKPPAPSKEVLSDAKECEAQVQLKFLKSLNSLKA